MRIATLLIAAAGLCVLSCSKDVNTAAGVGPVVAAGAGAQGGHALDNVHSLGELISGGVPEGDPAFDELKALGVKTIISVDGASPDLARAKARGMRYVHIPITYSDVPEKQKLEIARAIRDLPGPVYIHCHHGKHRSPAATAAAAVALGLCTPEEGLAFMKKAGTAPNYTGLYRCVAEGTVASEEEISAADGAFPEVQRPEGIVAAMVEVDIAYENLGFIRAAGWVTPKDHPDLVPSAEAKRLADQLRFSGEDTRVKAKGDDYAAKLASAIAHASELEAGIVKKESKEQLEAKWKLVAASCKECHSVYRDLKAQ